MQDMNLKFAERSREILKNDMGSSISDKQAIKFMKKSYIFKHYTNYMFSFVSVCILIHGYGLTNLVHGNNLQAPFKTSFVSSSEYAVRTRNGPLSPFPLSSSDEIARITDTLNGESETTSNLDTANERDERRMLFRGDEFLFPRNEPPNSGVPFDASMDQMQQVNEHQAIANQVSDQRGANQSVDDLMLAASSPKSGPSEEHSVTTTTTTTSTTTTTTPHPSVELTQSSKVEETDYNLTDTSKSTTTTTTEKLNEGGSTVREETISMSTSKPALQTTSSDTKTETELPQTNSSSSQAKVDQLTVEITVNPNTVSPIASIDTTTVLSTTTTTPTTTLTPTTTSIPTTTTIGTPSRITNASIIKSTSTEYIKSENNPDQNYKQESFLSPRVFPIIESSIRNMREQMSKLSNQDNRPTSSVSVRYQDMTFQSPCSGGKSNCTFSFASIPIIDTLKPDDNRTDGNPQIVNEFVFVPHDVPISIDQSNYPVRKPTDTSELRAEHRGIDDSEDASLGDDLDLDYMITETDKTRRGPQSLKLVEAPRETSTKEIRSNVPSKTDKFEVSSSPLNLFNTSTTTTTTTTTSTTTKAPLKSKQTVVQTKYQQKDTANSIANGSIIQPASSSVAPSLVFLSKNIPSVKENVTPRASISNKWRSDPRARLPEVVNTLTTKRPQMLRTRFKSNRQPQVSNENSGNFWRNLSPMANGADEEEARILTRYAIPSQLSRIPNNHQTQTESKRDSSTINNNNHHHHHYHHNRQSNIHERSAIQKTKLVNLTRTNINPMRDVQNLSKNSNQTSIATKRTDPSILQPDIAFEVTHPTRSSENLIENGKISTLPTVSISPSTSSSMIRTLLDKIEISTETSKGPSSNHSNEDTLTLIAGPAEVKKDSNELGTDAKIKILSQDIALESLHSKAIASTTEPTSSRVDSVRSTKSPMNRNSYTTRRANLSGNREIKRQEEARLRELIEELSQLSNENHKIEDSATQSTSIDIKISKAKRPSKEPTSSTTIENTGQWNPSENSYDWSSGSTTISGKSSSTDLLPGRAGIDYPTNWKVPKTSFDCRNFEQSGLYADTESNCQAYHSCHKGRGGQHTFLCPNGTLFSQELLTCDWWYNVECSNLAISGKPQSYSNIDRTFLERPANELSAS